MALPSGAALLPAERRAVATLAAIYATRLFGLFLLLPVLALHAGAMPGGTPLLAGLAVGAYGLTQALTQIPFGIWSDRIGRRPVIAVGLVLHVAGSALGALAGSAAALVAARVVQGTGAVSGPVMALLADVTRPAARTRAMFAIGLCIGACFVLSLVAGPVLASALGVTGVFVVIGALGILALGLACFALPPVPPRSPVATPRAWRDALSRRHLPQYAGVFVLHLTLTAAFVAVPVALRDVHGLALERHWLVYLGVFAASAVLTVPLVLWSERDAGRRRAAGVAGALMAASLAVLAGAFSNLTALVLALVAYFGAFNFLEARLPAALAEAAGPETRGSALGLFGTCQFAGAFAGGVVGGGLLGSAWFLAGVFACAAGAALAWLPWCWAGESRRSGANDGARDAASRLQ